MNGQIIAFTTEALWLVLLLSAPPIIAASVVGLLVAVVQAATQLQEQTLHLYRCHIYALSRIGEMIGHTLRLRSRA
jgi:type III secretion protein S